MILEKNEDEKIEAAKQVQLAAEVRELYDTAISGHLGDHPDVGDDDVRKVAFGLVILRQITDQFLKKFEADPDPRRIPNSGLPDASAIIDALTTGKDHAIFRYIKGLRASRKRRGADQERREMLGGLACAYAEAAGVSVREASLAVVEFIKPNGRFNDEQLRKWVRDYDVSRYTERFLNEAKAFDDRPLAEEVLKVGRKHFWRYWTTPSVKSG